MKNKILQAIVAISIITSCASCSNSITVTESSINLSDYDGSSVKIEAAGSYTLSGTMIDGQVIVDAGDDNVTLILNNVSITCSNDAPIFVEDGSVTVHLADGTENSLADTAKNSASAVLYSKDDLVISGTGSLSVDANYNDGITSSNGLTIEDGIIDIDAVDDGLQGEDFVVIEAGTLKISAGTASGTGIKADDEEENYITINGGDITVSQCYEGIESKNITINAGNIDITSEDDGINLVGDGDESSPFTPPGRAASSYYLEINGGVIFVDSDGDGLDANGSITMSAGTVIVSGPTDDGNGALDYDGTFAVTGGTLAAAGSSGMAEAPSSSSNGCIDITFSSTQSAGKLVTIFNPSDELVLAYAPPKQFRSLIFTSADIVSGDSYTVKTGGSVSGTETGGWYSDAAAVISGTTYSSVTAD